MYFKNSKLEGDFGYSLNNRKELEAPDEIAFIYEIENSEL